MRFKDYCGICYFSQMIYIQYQNNDMMMMIFCSLLFSFVQDTEV